MGAEGRILSNACKEQIMNTSAHPQLSHHERIIQLASRGFRLIKVALYQNKHQLALDIADSMQHLPLVDHGPEYDQLNSRLDHVATKYDNENDLHGFADSWLRWASDHRADA